MKFYIKLITVSFIILITLFVFPISSNAGLLPRYDGNIEIEFKNYNDNNIVITEIDGKDPDLILENGIYFEFNKGKVSRLVYRFMDNDAIKPIFNFEITNNDGTITKILIDGTSRHSGLGDYNPYYEFATYDANTGKYKNNNFKVFYKHFEDLPFEVHITTYGFLLVIVIIIIYLILKIIKKHNKKVK